MGVNYSSLRNTRGGSEDGAAIDAPGNGNPGLELILKEKPA